MEELMFTLSHNELQCHRHVGILTGALAEGDGHVGQRKVLGLGASQVYTRTWLCHLPPGGM